MRFLVNFITARLIILRVKIANGFENLVPSIFRRVISGDLRIRMCLESRGF